jgi:hypothetical protein
MSSLTHGLAVSGIRWAVASSIAAASLLSACEEEPSPPEKCDAMLETACDRLGSCMTSATNEDLPPDWQTTCLDKLRVGLGRVYEFVCPYAFKVDDDEYDGCIDTLNSSSCDAVFDFHVPGTYGSGFIFPSSCFTAFSIGK